MYQGFYNLASGMLTQSRNLNVISNNMVNVQTSGYKNDKMVSTTFQEEMLYRTGRRNKENPVPLASTSKIKTASRTYIDYEQGNFDQTDGLYDFAIAGKGFFCVQTPGGQERYTRNGAFSVDNEGYLILEGLGRVLSTDNEPIQIESEDFNVDASGNIVWNPEPEVSEDGDAEEAPDPILFGTLKVVDFADYDQLHREDGGVFSTDQAQIEINQNQDQEEGQGQEVTKVMWKVLEKSNVNMVEEMTAMMTSQRALQSAAQVFKMYDQVMGKSSTEIGRI